MAGQERDTQTYWRRDKEARYTLIVRGEQAAIVNRDEHTAALGPSPPLLKPIPVPHSREIFAEVENRLGIPAVQEFRGLDGSEPVHPRDDSLKRANEFRRHVPPAKEPEHYLRKSLQRLEDLGDIKLTGPGLTAISAIRYTLRDLQANEGKWSDTSNNHFRTATTALHQLPPEAHRLERLAHLDLEKAHATLHQVRSVRNISPENDRSKDAGKDRDNPGRER